MNDHQRAVVLAAFSGMWFLVGWLARGLFNV